MWSTPSTGRIQCVGPPILTSVPTTDVLSHYQPMKQENSFTPTGPSSTNNSASYAPQTNLPPNPMTGMQTGYEQYGGGGAGGGGYGATGQGYAVAGNFPGSSGMDALMLADLNWVSVVYRIMRVHIC